MHSKQIKAIFFTLLALVTMMPGLSWGATSGTLNIRVAASYDDAEEDRTSGREGQMNLTSDDLDMITDPVNKVTDRLIGLRFRNVTIPQGATITSAYLEFVVDEVDSNTATLTIWGEDTDDSNTFSYTNSDISNRAKTATYVEWSVSSWETVGDVHQSEDIKGIVQEITDRTGWTAGNDMTFIIGGIAADAPHRVAESYNAGSSVAPLLHVEYTATAIDAFPASYNDDAEESHNGEMDLDDDVLELLKEMNNDQTVGIRFVNVGVPQGAIITKAYLEFTATADASADHENDNNDDNKKNNNEKALRIRGEAADNAAQYTTDKDNIKKRDTTGQEIKWKNLPEWKAGNDYTSPDITAIVQEIVGRAGWASGNAMAFKITGRGERAVMSYDGADGDAALMPRLHIEYEEDTAPYITVDTTVLGGTCYVTKNPSAGEFTITNTGGGELNYTISESADWMTLSETSGTLAVGASVTITVTYNTSSKDAGTYEETITIEDSNAKNSPVEIAASVTVYTLPEESSCDHIPLYAQDIVSPSILILLDVSGSMDWTIDVAPEEYPQTPDLSSIVKEIVDRSAWTPGNAMAFIITGTGERNAVSYDGDSGDAPLLHVEYNDGTDDHVLEVAITQSSDDAEQGKDGHMYLNGTDLDLVYDNVNQTVGLRFQDITIPQGATITNAYIAFAISASQDTETNLVITGEASDNAATFAGGKNGGTWENNNNISNRTTTTAQVAWSDVAEWVGATQKKRIDIGRDAISSLVTDRQINWGFGTWTGNYDAGSDYTKIHVGCDNNDDAHQTALQNAISAATPEKGTPFQPSLVAGRKYFTGDKSDENGEKYVNNECESLILIEVTDGLGNTGTTLEGVKTEAENIAKENISLVTVGFGIDDATQIEAAAAVANEWGNKDEEDKLYALHEEVDGVGVPFLANNEAELVGALASIKSAVLDNLFHGSAPATTTTTELGNLLLVANFNAGDWTGNLQAMSKDANGDWMDEDGNWTTVKWSASENFGARNIFTVDANGTYTAFSDFTTNYLSCKNMGDIINSTPIVVTNPASYYIFDGYEAWMDSMDRDPMVYVGANDGALHAFKLENGEEQWAFVPKSMKAKLDKGLSDAEYDMCDTEYCHQYYVDGSPKVADVYLSTGWKTILVSGLREGGESYFALDVTHGNSFDESDPTVYMWEFTDTELGETWSDASINRVVVDGTSDTKWGVFFGSGYATTDVAQADKDAYLYGILAEDKGNLWYDGGEINKVKVFDKILLRYDNVVTEFGVGEVIKGAASNAQATIVAMDSAAGVLEIEGLTGTFQDNETITGNDATAPGEALVNGDVQEGLTDNALNSPLAVDLDGDGQYIVDHIYVGDLYGTMYRVSNIGYAQAPQVSTLLDLGLFDNDVSPIRAKAGYAYSETAGEIWVYWGTGIYETMIDKINTEPQYFFGVRDKAGAGEVAKEDLVALAVKTGTYEDEDENEIEYKYIDGENAENKSWYLELENNNTMLGSERVLQQPMVVGGVVFFTTFIPNDELCSGSGTSWLYALDYETGLPPEDPVFEDTPDDCAAIKIGDGIASAPVLNEDDEVFTNLTEGGTKKKDVTLPGLSVQLESWRHQF